MAEYGKGIVSKIVIDAVAILIVVCGAGFANEMNRESLLPDSRGLENDERNGLYCRSLSV